MHYDICFTDGGVTAPQGFTANGVLCKIKPNRKTNDTALIFSEKPCTAAGLFTQNRVKAESVKLTQKHIAGRKIQAVIANSGNANACTGEKGAENAYRMAKSAADALGISPEDVIVCSTGVIGQQLPVEKIERNMESLKSGLSKKGHEQARVAIMTTDTQYKECAVKTVIGGKTVTIGAMCKGSGMIHINLGTMLCFITTDCAINKPMLEKALRLSAEGTFNCVSIDGDTSTNDTLTIMANGMAGNAQITSEGKDFDTFFEALNALSTVMAKKIAADGEGASRLIECRTVGAKDIESARQLAKEVIGSNLVKAAMFGKDANWGRILCAMGYSGAYFTPEKTSVYFISRTGAHRYFTPGKEDEAGPLSEKIPDNGILKKDGIKAVKVFELGVPLNFDEDLAKEILKEEAVQILVTMEDGNAEARAWGCDLTYDYVKINGDYRT
ncbi:bifunctional glutamate N-acetyltransferase/amino-acid acetyltransferase ArgJ [Treponema parvum]|uniref:Arginine biosynthesis bifunctional protein ArgJ n=1 Tax=Treponema parvum TaxID=138851 RepID=A0A975EY78_9SPIR|nr:bifunctional glutamate N-acetyltransferase/amino-acid acetyltransferase ArgJ [Treponema parvum]QTQ11156.1 bifunctional glutamate N-acetyltransferase/amino-acid acetyltransferase ArgJ [Treponema parvum]